ncbi:MAG: alpha/beta fold hydrolase [Candidatus Riflebacteria bacterium]|nr:alpha/beta fold hydrolase [Candidatus Riflebacteria bacterium]
MQSENQGCLEGAARAMECLFPQELLDEAWKTPRRLHNLIRLISGELLPSLAQTPCDEIARWGRVRLLRYKVAAARQRCPVLMVPSIINRHYILDLRPGESMVEFLVQQGIPVYLLDWGKPGPQDRYATLEDHILRWQGAAVREACRDAGVSAIHMLGYCLGGTFVAAYAALRPKRVAGVLALTAPINFHDDSLLSVWARSDVWNIEQLANEFGLIPAELLQASFQQLNPVAQLQKLRVFV